MESSLASVGPVQETTIQKPFNQGLESSYVPKKQKNCAGQSSSNNYDNTIKKAINIKGPGQEECCCGTGIGCSSK
uniref:Uncharacterized protein n=1 Tax=Oryza glumipatula TaxID=40148 RepID=A0A0E0BGY1_9ORYZ